MNRPKGRWYDRTGIIGLGHTADTMGKVRPQRQGQGEVGPWGVIWEGWINEGIVAVGQHLTFSNSPRSGRVWHYASVCVGGDWDETLPWFPKRCGLHWATGDRAICVLPPSYGTLLPSLLLTSRTTNQSISQVSFTLLRLLLKWSST